MTSIVSRRSVLSAAGTLLAATAWPGSGRAASFPGKPVTLIVPYTPAGITDLYGRVIGQHLQERWGQTVLIDNRAGAGTVIGTQAAIRAPADGHTLLLTSYALTSNQVLLKSLPYDTAALAPLTMMGHSRSMLVVQAGSPLKTLKDVVAKAKSQPGALKLASSGNGSSPHIAASMFANLIGAAITHIPYKGTAPAMQDLHAGLVDGIFDGPSSMVQVRAGKLHAIGLAGETRHPNALEVPTFRELGLDFVFGSWFGFFSQAATPAPIRQQLHADLRAVLAQPDTREQIGRGGLQLVENSPDDFARFLQDELARLRKVVAASPDQFTIE